MNRAQRDTAAREVVRGWFSGREDLFAAVERIVAGQGPCWWAFALAPRATGRRPGSGTGLGCEDGFEVVAAALDVGYRTVAAWGGSAEERDELAPPADRVEVLRALTLLAETELDAAPGGGA